MFKVGDTVKYTEAYIKGIRARFNENFRGVVTDVETVGKNTVFYILWSDGNQTSQRANIIEKVGGSDEIQDGESR